MTRSIAGSLGYLGFSTIYEYAGLLAYGREGLERAIVLLVVSLAAMFIAGPVMLADSRINV
ncbi:MAG: hypothetical protein ACRCYY_10625 [Trueperaceae bacterium]